jgi:hypothetical protein
MVDASTVEEILSLLSAGNLSQRKIARKVGVSRGTVNAIARGKRSSSPTRPRVSHDYLMPAGPPTRCPTCGGLVKMPCLLCRVRELRAAGIIGPEGKLRRRKTGVAQSEQRSNALTAERPQLRVG